MTFLLKSHLRRRLDPAVSGRGGHDDCLLCWTWALRRRIICSESYLRESYALWVVRKSCRTVLQSTRKDLIPIFPMMVLPLLTSLLLFQRRMAEAHEDEDTVIEEEYKVIIMFILWQSILCTSEVEEHTPRMYTNFSGVEEEYSLPLWLGDYACLGMAQVCFNASEYYWPGIIDISYIILKLPLQLCFQLDSSVASWGDQAWRERL